MKEKTWFENELKLGIKSEGAGDMSDYGIACYESAAKAYKSLEEDNHSGFSIHATKHILNRLIDRQPLTPVVDIPEMWFDHGDTSDYRLYQHKRMSRLFAHVYPDNTFRYSDVDRIQYKGDVKYKERVIDLVDRLYPIEMPYYGDTIIVMVVEAMCVKTDSSDIDSLLLCVMVNDHTPELRYFKNNAEVSSLGYKLKVEV